MKTVAVFLFLSLFTLVPPLCKGESVPLRVVMDDNYPPFVFRSPDGRLQGILVDQWRLWEKKTGVPVEIRGMEWDRAIREMESGMHDVIDTLFSTPQREKVFSFTPPYRTIEVPIFFHRDITGIKDTESLKEFPVAVKRGDAAVEYLKQRGVYSLLEYDSYEAIIRDALAQKIAVFVVDKPPALYYLYKFGIQDYYRLSTPPLYKGAFHRAVRKGNDVLLALVKKGFSLMTKEELRAIDTRWLGETVERPIVLRYVLVGVLCGLFLVSLLMTWNYTLQKEVKARTKMLSQTLDKLKGSERKYRSLFENLLDIYFQVDHKGTLILLSPSVGKALGRAPEELLGQRAVDLVSFPERAEAKALFEALRTQGYVEDKEVLLGEGAEKKWFSLNARMVWDQEGKEFTVEGTLRDIDQRKRYERALREEKERMDATLRSVDEGVLTLDRAGEVVLMNRAAEELTGWNYQAAMGKGVESVCRLKREGTIRLLTREEILSRRDLRGEMRLLLRNLSGEEILVALTLVSLRSEGEEQEGLLLLLRDIRERQKLEEEMLKGQKLESLGVFAGGIAHDFNNLLAGILGNISLAKRFLPSPEKLAHKLEEVERASLRARDLTLQLLTFSKGGAPQKKNVTLRHLLKESVEFVLSGSSVEAEYAFPEDLWSVEADEGQIGQVVRNIVLNSRQAMNERGRISIGCENVPSLERPDLCGGKYVKIKIRDNGPGIPREQHHRIFDPFYTTKAKGSGLGLTVSHSIVKKHGGVIELESTPGEGSLFAIYLPASGNGRGEKKVLCEERRAENVFSGRVLLMDDETILRQVGSDILSLLGFQVDTVCDGEAALSSYRKAKEEGLPYTLLVMDLTIRGGMGGVETIQRLREMDPEVLAIVSSGYSSGSVLSEYREYGFSGIVSKPYRVEEMARVVERVLREAPAEC